jgi:putative holliday junction resolvase
MSILLIMARIIGIDYGAKRCGIAVTDPFQIIVSAIATVDTSNIMVWLKEYLQAEKVEKIVIGLPTHKDGNFTHLKPEIDTFAAAIAKSCPDIMIDFADEQFSSAQAKQIIMQRGANKKTRQDKALVDRVSAVIILQKYLGHI